MVGYFIRDKRYFATPEYTKNVIWDSLFLRQKTGIIFLLCGQKFGRKLTPP